MHGSDCPKCGATGQSDKTCSSCGAVCTPLIRFAFSHVQLKPPWLEQLLIRSFYANKFI
ncbi:uncharacterized protein LY89DRAFT_683482 [Mollisia scopiformis]|uniref:Uncharacterized protein n=1 Tax=Mollisia scopiformis TaxID=149040 RepID=A0A194XEB2_MOLSC|nr:uncharacterized protein LY89DRAFT_683482 [Mollisia scopiformis]KUJ18525.1 hypothetical protein LY89DRAFT_683482 [Mollisia scopiformis]